MALVCSSDFLVCRQGLFCVYKGKIMERNGEIIVVKIGSSSVSDNEYGLRKPVFRSVAMQISELYLLGNRIVLISSGAVAAGRKKLENSSRNGDLIDKQKAAIYGQGPLMRAWEDAFNEFGVNVGQVLLTGHDLENSKRPILEALEDGVPIVNANDPVNVDELREYTVARDNDQMAGRVTRTLGASKLIIQTDVNGVKDGDDQVIKTISRLDDLRRIRLKGKSSLGTGGMRSKIKVSLHAVRRGCDVWIINAADSQGIIKAVSGEAVGTYFPGRSATFKEGEAGVKIN